MSDQRVGMVGQSPGQQHGIGKVIQGGAVGMHPAYGLDQVVQGDGKCGHASTLG
ncbi:hypothetical protein L830_2616 [Mycobacteroides abscessus MAB_082312_2258]|nr:hypothetical protein L830_2616 [Mycobacteroides abscessus MAB_082312_2258]